jgi:methionine aminopeptidase
MVYKRAIERMYNLKGKSARNLFNEIIDKFPSMCFTLRAFEDEISAKLGLRECLEHDVLVPYPVMVEKSGEYVANFKFTVMISEAATT